MFKLNTLEYQKAQLLGFINKKEKNLNLEAFRRCKKRVEILTNCLHNSMREKELEIFSVSL